MVNENLSRANMSGVCDLLQFSVRVALCSLIELACKFTSLLLCCWKVSNLVSLFAHRRVYCPMAMGSAPGLWGPDAAEFKPERMSAAGGVRPSPFKYIAFNAGPRACLGQQMATVESTYVLALLASAFSFSIVEGHRVKAGDSITLPMRYGLRVRAVRRQKNE